MTLVFLICALMFGLPTLAKAGGVFELSASVVAGGGISGAAGEVAMSTTAGQPVTQPAQDGNFTIQPGFWPLLQAAPPTSPATAAATATATSTPPPTQTPTATPANSATATRTSIPSPTPPPTLADASPTPFPSPLSPTPAATPVGCTGDCDDDGAVTVDEIVRMVNIALTGEGLASCPTADLGGDGVVTVEEIIVAVNHALDGCDAPQRASFRGGSDEQE